MKFYTEILRLKLAEFNAVIVTMHNEIKELQ